ncbi:hypothetical protein [Lusitaniella coriacea]|uniref:hypothetical protein n=1 Tax=Lusitaniella coriacea TaxID=1983105 RepID=UPI003CF5F1EF
MEIHSHHHLPAYFSAQDDTDESGCKIYGVLGTIFTRPALRLRVGLYNRQFWEIPTNWAFEESCWTSNVGT